MKEREKQPALFNLNPSAGLLGLRHYKWVVGKERLDKMDVVMAGDDVTKKKPDPLIYNLAREKIGRAVRAVILQGQPPALLVID